MSVGNELDYHETISLLQEEIARLEEEVRVRDEMLAGEGLESHHADLPVDDGAEQRIASLAAELAIRDETIGLLLEQARLFEEAESANQASWEQLHQWVEELEKRVENQTEDANLRAELEAERQKAEAERQAAETQRRILEAQRQELTTECEQLRATLSKAARSSGSAGKAALEALEKENRRLREASSDLARLSAEAAQVDALRQQVHSVREELVAARKALQQANDDRQREKNEHEAALAAHRSELARESLKRQEGQIQAAIGGASSAEPGVNSNPLLAPDERIRALRQHLKEIHEREVEERANRRLSARLSRLWRNTGPRG